MSVSISGLLLGVLQGGTSSAFQYNSNSTSTQFVLVSGACTLVRVSNPGTNPVDVFDASTTGQPGTNVIFIVPGGAVMEVNWPMANGVVLSIPQNSGAAVSYSA